MSAMKAYVFPGQGSQKVGMSAGFLSLKDYKTYFEKANDTLGFDLTKLMTEGPADELTLTQNTQPALLLAGIVAYKWHLENGGEAPAYFVGHSLGEWTALVAAGVLSLEDGLKLVHLRGQAMQRAVPAGKGGMLAVIGLTPEQATAVAKDTGAFVANDNSDGQVVLSGDKVAITKATEMAKIAGAKRALPLPVSAPFHCPLMAPAADEMAQALEEIVFNEPSAPVICNVTARPETDPEKLKENLIAQITGQVRWRESMQWLADNDVTHLTEFGSGKVLCGLAPRCDKRLSGVAITEPKSEAA